MSFVPASANVDVWVSLGALAAAGAAMITAFLRERSSSEAEDGAPDETGPEATDEAPRGAGPALPARW